MTVIIVSAAPLSSLHGAGGSGGSHGDDNDNAAGGVGDAMVVCDSRELTATSVCCEWWWGYYDWVVMLSLLFAVVVCNV